MELITVAEGPFGKYAEQQRPLELADIVIHATQIHGNLLYVHAHIPGASEIRDRQDWNDRSEKTGGISFVFDVATGPVIKNGPNLKTRELVAAEKYILGPASASNWSGAAVDHAIRHHGVTSVLLIEKGRAKLAALLAKANEGTRDSVLKTAEVAETCIKDEAGELAGLRAEVARTTEKIKALRKLQREAQDALHAAALKKLAEYVGEKVPASIVTVEQVLAVKRRVNFFEA